MAKNIIKYVITIIAIIIAIWIFLTIYSYASKSQEDALSLNEKINQEFKYLDNKLISVINSLNNLDTESLILSNEIIVDQSNGGSSGSAGGSSEEGAKNKEEIKTNVTTVNIGSILKRDRNIIDWQFINKSLEEINNSWFVIKLDLRDAGIKDEVLNNFETNLDIVLRYSVNEDKQNTLISLANLYSLLPDYESAFSNSGEKIELKYLKSDIISSYALLDTNRWNEIYPLLNDSEVRMSKLITITNNNSNVKIIEVKLKDYIKSAKDMDVDLCYMKYYYLLKEIENKE